MSSLSELEMLRKYAHEATKALSDLAGGGSELFSGKIGDMYIADILYCRKRIRERHDMIHRHLLQEISRRKAAEEAVKALEPGEPEINAAQEQISEGIGAYLRKFTDSLDAARARDHLHKMPKSEWAGLTRTLAEEAVTAAFRAARRVREGGESDA